MEGAQRWRTELIQTSRKSRNRAAAVPKSRAINEPCRYILVYGVATLISRHKRRPAENTRGVKGDLLSAKYRASVAIGRLASYQAPPLYIQLILQSTRRTRRGTDRD